MFETIFWFFVIGGPLASALAVCFPLWGPWFLLKLAENNFIVTTCREGTAKARIKYGADDSGEGTFAGMLKPLSWEGRHYNCKWDVIDADSEEAKKPGNEPVPLSFIESLLPKGILYVGLPFANGIKKSHFQWTNLRQGAPRTGAETDKAFESIVEQDKLKDLMISRDEEIDYILLMRDVYCVNFQEMEDGDMIPLSFILEMTIRIKNPRKALFETEQWLEQTTNFLRPYIKVYVGNRKYVDLTSANKDVKEESDKILCPSSPAGTPIKNYILDQWGVDIEQANLVDFKTAGALGLAYQQSAATAYLKEQEAKGIVIIAKANAEALEIGATAEAKRIDTVTKALRDGGPDALTLRTLETYETMGEKGNTIVIGGEKPPQLLIDSTRRKN